MKNITLAVLIALAAALDLPANAQNAEKDTDKSGTEAKSTEPFAPGLGEIMSLQQMRHSKLWFAGRRGNWGLADYEADELKEGFEDIEKMFPTKDGVALTPVVQSITSNELPNLEKAIEAKDRAKFQSAFDRLTAACNGCHATTKHEFIVIQRPTGLPYTNQNFSPARANASTARRRRH